MSLEIQTDRPGLILRQYTPSDSGPLFDLIDRNREHLSQFGDDTARKYPDQESVLQNILNPPQPTRVRFGIWDKSVLVGAANLDPRDNFVILGYWIGSEFTRRGYASTATITLYEYAVTELQISNAAAWIHRDNTASKRVLEKCGFSFWKEYPPTDLCYWRSLF